MESVLIQQIFDKLPIAELEHSLTSFLAPLLDRLPDRRLRRVVPLAVRGILAGETPVVTGMAQSVARTDARPWAAAKRIYRLLDNPRVSPRRLTHGLYHLARATVAQEQPPYLVVAIDPVNFEKPYTRKLPGVSTVYKSTPPPLRGKAASRAGIRPSPPPWSTPASRQRPTLTGSPTAWASAARTGRSNVRCA